jgi:hypothetical protein
MRRALPIGNGVYVKEIVQKLTQELAANTAVRGFVAGIYSKRRFALVVRFADSFRSDTTNQHEPKYVRLEPGVTFEAKPFQIDSLQASRFS